MSKDILSGAQRLVQVLLALVLTIGALYWGREVLIPLAMAVLLTFLLTPLVKALERRRLGRVPAVLIAMLALFAITATVAWVIGSQLNDLANSLPTYRENLKTKMQSLSLSGGAMQKVEQTLSEVETKVDDRDARVQQVRVLPSKVSPFEKLQPLFATVVGPAATAGLVLVLVVFMLISREDLRNRLVRLAGARLALTTRTLDEVGTRISRYLLLNAIVNGGFGFVIGLGLMLIGVEYAWMWGFLAAILRFLPYIGPVIASAMPVGMAFIQFPGNDWIHPILAAALFIVLELITNNVIEPLAYGSSTGVSTVALLVSAMFWTWVWGPLGLVLAVPLTVVLAVLGESIAALEPLAILLGDKPPLANHITYYQRLLAGDVDEACGILEDEARGTSLIMAYDSVVIPALVLAERDRHSGELQETEQQTVWQATRDFMDELDPKKEISGFTIGDGLQSIKARIVGCPAHDAADETALLILKQTIDVGPAGLFEVLPVTMLVSEMLAQVEQFNPDAVCVSSLGPVGVRQTRYLCKRLRQNFPALRIIVGRWGYAKGREKMAQTLKERGADQVVTSLVEAHDQFLRITPLVAPAIAETSAV